MPGPSLTIPFADFSFLKDETVSDLMAYIADKSGQSAELEGDAESDEHEPVRLTASQATAFLNNCSEKSTSVIRYIVEHDGSVLRSEICDLTGNQPSQLRGLWSGLTKRTLTITKGANGLLLAWSKSGDDWRITMDAETVASFRSALALQAA